MKYQKEYTQFVKYLIFLSIIIGILITTIALYVHGNVYGAEIPEMLAVKAIVGEAQDQGYQGMLAVACGIRNRGHLKGVYGLNNPNTKKAPAWVWQRAMKAWNESLNKDIVNGADHWENIKAFGQPSWGKDMVVTCRVKDHTFYKLIRN